MAKSKPKEVKEVIEVVGVPSITEEPLLATEIKETETPEIIVSPAIEGAPLEEGKAENPDLQAVEIIKETKAPEITKATILEDFVMQVAGEGYSNVFVTVNFKKGDVVTRQHLLNYLKKSPKSILFE